MSEKRDRRKKIIGRPLGEILHSVPNSVGGGQGTSEDNDRRVRLSPETVLSRRPVSLSGIVPPETDQLRFKRMLNRTQIVNIPFMLINEILGETAERLGVCECTECLAAYTYYILEEFEIEDRFVKVTDKLGEDYVNHLLEHYRPILKNIIVKICIKAKNKPYHV